VRRGPEAAGSHGVVVDVGEESRTPVVSFDAQLRDRVADVVRRETGVAPLLPTGAGHDAGVLAAEVPTAMVFVRNPTGTSHSPAEEATRADCLVGVRVLAALLEELACR
jgi:N-carbamoyl-L-amino-acid hydrolase